MKTLCDTKKRRLELDEYQTFLKKGRDELLLLRFGEKKFQGPFSVGRKSQSLIG